MLDIDSIMLRNFRSYGDYETRLTLSDLKTCLICGIIGSNEKKKNGAGKSTLIEAILWCVFGKTSKVQNPGDRVINRFIKKNCTV